MAAPQLRADHALRAALLNLLNNAADASPHEMDILLDWNDTNIMLEIRDHGPGLTPEAAARAGSAFFTTKQEGEGTGLGLSLVYGIVQNQGGEIKAQNSPGKGATFIIDLPIMPKDIGGNRSE